MAIKEKIDELFAKIPSEVSREEFAESIEKASSSVVITGAILDKDETNIVIIVGDMRLRVPISEILNIVEAEAVPSVGAVGIYVHLSVNPNAEITEVRKRKASELGDRIGIRPFVYEIPSNASRYAVSSEEYEIQQSKWRQQVGLADFKQIMTSPSPYLSSDPTATNSPYTTVEQTATPEDTQTDRPLDYKTDSQTDYKTDYKTDQD